MFPNVISHSKNHSSVLANGLASWLRDDWPSHFSAWDLLFSLHSGLMMCFLGIWYKGQISEAIYLYSKAWNLITLIIWTSIFDRVSKATKLPRPEWTNICRSRGATFSQLQQVLYTAFILCNGQEWGIWGRPRLIPKKLSTGEKLKLLLDTVLST